MTERKATMTNKTRKLERLTMDIATSIYDSSVEGEGKWCMCPLLREVQELERALSFGMNTIQHYNYTMHYNYYNYTTIQYTTTLYNRTTGYKATERELLGKKLRKLLGIKNYRVNMSHVFTMFLLFNFLYMIFLLIRLLMYQKRVTDQEF